MSITRYPAADLSPNSSGKTKELGGIEVEFRIPFQISNIKGGVSMVGASHENVKLLSLDFSGE